MLVGLFDVHKDGEFRIDVLREANRIKEKLRGKIIIEEADNIGWSKKSEDIWREPGTYETLAYTYYAFYHASDYTIAQHKVMSVAFRDINLVDAIKKKFGLNENIITIFGSYHYTSLQIVAGDRGYDFQYKVYTPEDLEDPINQVLRTILTINLNIKSLDEIHEILLSKEFREASEYYIVKKYMATPEIIEAIERRYEGILKEEFKEIAEIRDKIGRWYETGVEPDDL